MKVAKVENTNQSECKLFRRFLASSTFFPPLLCRHTTILTTTRTGTLASRTFLKISKNIGPLYGCVLPPRQQHLSPICSCFPRQTTYLAKCLFYPFTLTFKSSICSIMTSSIDAYYPMNLEFEKLKENSSEKLSHSYSATF